MTRERDRWHKQITKELRGREDLKRKAEYRD